MFPRIVLSAFLLSAVSHATQFDVVVYGATAGGVTSAIAAARQGLKTALVEAGRHVGGMATGGLSRTDVGRREVIGGLALEFYYRTGIRYEIQRFNQPVAWFYEPKVGEGVMVEMLRRAGVTLLYNHRLKEAGGVRKEGTVVRAITTENGETFEAKVFVDASYEGDLMAQAKVSYTWGREGMDQYGESLAGVRDRTPKHQFTVNIPARVEGRLLPEISAEPPGAAGQADRRVQAYNFRIIATNVAANRIPWPKPAGYDPGRYELLLRNVLGLTQQKGRAPVFHEMTLIAPIPGGKADFNNQGAFSTDYIGKNYGYPEGNYATRARIWQDHIGYVQGYYYFLANDPRVPQALREEVNDWGLPKDEYLDTNHWPHQLYVREARRMVGEFVMTQKDLQTALTKPDVIGMGSYNSDSHNVQRFVNAQGFAENEGDMQVPVKPYQIPYRVMLPKRGEVTNLLVPVCFSASHVAYSSLRMEPQYMIMGQAAGVAAKLAIRDSKPVQAVDVAELQKTLKEQAAVFTFVPNEQIEALSTLRNLLRPPAPARFNWE
ncbi:MAG: FAD-dependent oxidoreductase [Bryobacteraceae bacterium]|nr:FAD-dependent oxidoreductase [Bryobacteraceae bacterium]